MEISTLSGPASQLPSLTAAGDSVATAQNCCNSESPACSPTHSPAAPGRPSARPGQTLSRPPLGGQPPSQAWPNLNCRHSGPTVTVTAAPALAPGLHSVTPSQWPPRHRVTVRLAAGVTVAHWQRLPGPHWQAGRAPPARLRCAAPTRPGGGPPRPAEQCDVCRQNVPQF